MLLPARLVEKQLQKMSYAQAGRQQPTNQQDPGAIYYSSQVQPGHVSYGLSMLAPIAMLSFEQDASVVQAITGLSAAQRFRIFNEHGQLIMNAIENPNDVAHRVCCAANRGFVLHITDASNQEIIRISREFICCGGRCPWCADTEYCKYEGIVESPPGVVIGTVRQVKSFYRTHMSLNNASGVERLHIIGPYCICQGIICCCCENKFKLMTPDRNTEIGGVFKEYAGVVNQAMTGAEKYSIRFPVDLPPQDKALALAALFLINFKHFGGNAESKGGFSVLSCLC